MGKKRKSSKSKETVIVTYVFLAIFIALLAYFAYYVQVKSADFADNSYNARISTLSEKVIRGDILASDGTVLATTITDSDGNEARSYPYGRIFAHAVGYSTNGMMGIESDANYSLLSSNSSIFDLINNALSGAKDQGDSVVTTLNLALQEACYNALGDYDGAVVCIEPSTGKILAMVSKPDFNPNTISDDWDSIVDETSDSTALLNRVTQGLYTPGSVFKIFTLCAYLEQADSTDFSFECSGAYALSSDYSLHCYNSRVHGTMNLLSAFAKSCNGSFAKIGTGLELSEYIQTCERLLFNKSLPTSLKTTVVSRLELSADDDDIKVAQTSIGQGETLVSPLHMAMIASAICNGGKLMEPYIIDSIQNDSGSTIKTYSPNSYGQLFSSGEAASIEEYMRAVITDGTATVLDVGTYTAYGKTGTAEVDSAGNLENSWFVGYARDDDGNEIAIAIVYESISSGSAKASEATKKIFDVYFSE